MSPNIIPASRPLPPDVVAAYARREAALTAGIDQTARPADVASLAAVNHRLRVPGLSASETSHLQSLVREAVSGLDPQIVHTTSTPGVERMLANGGRIPNVYDMLDVPERDRPPLLQPPQQAAAGRAVLELARGTFGTGTNVYGTVHFSDIEHAPMVRHDGALRLREPEWVTGSLQYGDVAVVLRPQTLDRATFLPADSGLVGGSQLRAREELDEVLARRIAQNYLMGERAQPGMETTDQAFGGFRSVGEVQGNLRQILQLPRAQGVAAIREHLTSNAMSDRYAEAQMRWATVDDIAALHVTRMPKSVDPTGAWRKRQDALIATARARGIEVHTTDEQITDRVRQEERARILDTTTT